MADEGHGGPDFLVRGVVAGGVRRELAAPGEHSGVAYAALHDPEELVVGFGGRMRCELLCGWIESDAGFVAGAAVRSSVTTGAISFEHFHAGHQVFFRGRDRIWNLRRVAGGRGIERHGGA